MKIDYDLLNTYIGKKWVYIDNDCFSVAAEISFLVFGNPMTAVSLPDVSTIRNNDALYRAYFGGDSWGEVECIEPGDIALFKSARGTVVHMGIHIDRGEIVHCCGSDTVPGSTVMEPLRQLTARYAAVEFYRCQ